MTPSSAFDIRESQLFGAFDTGESEFKYIFARNLEKIEIGLDTSVQTVRRGMMEKKRKKKLKKIFLNYMSFWFNYYEKLYLVMVKINTYIFILFIFLETSCTYPAVDIFSMFSIGWGNLAYVFVFSINDCRLT